MRKQNIWDPKRTLRRRQLLLTRQSNQLKSEVLFVKNRNCMKNSSLSFYRNIHHSVSFPLIIDRRATLLCSRRTVCHPKPRTWSGFWWPFYKASHEKNTLKEENPFLFQVGKKYYDMQYGPQVEGISSVKCKKKKKKKRNVIISSSLNNVTSAQLKSQIASYEE